MLGYNFKLERVLNYKEDMENVKKGILGNINNKLSMEEEKLMNYNDNKDQLLKKKNEIQKKTDIRSLKLYNYHLEIISKNIKKQEQLINIINIELDKAKEELLEAVKEKKTLEKLKEKDLNEFKNELGKKQEKIIDNIVSFKNMNQK